MSHRRPRRPPVAAALLPLVCGLLCTCTTASSSAAQTAATGEPTATEIATVWIHLVEPAETGDGEAAAETDGASAPLAQAPRRRLPEVFGCGDRLVALAVPLAAAADDGAAPEDGREPDGGTEPDGEPSPDASPPTAARISAALGAQLAAAAEEAPPGLLDALRRTSLRVVRVEPVTTGDEIDWPATSEDDAAASAASATAAGVYRVVLAGRLEVGGVCDVPRLRAQLTATATQFGDVDEVELYLGDEPLDAVLSQRGLTARP